MNPAFVARIAGWLAILALGLLSSPGVRVVRAEGEPVLAPPPAAGPTCSTDSLGTAVVSIALPSEQEASERSRARQRPEVIRLDGGGDRYGRAESPRPGAPAAPQR